MAKSMRSTMGRRKTPASKAAASKAQATKSAASKNQASKNEASTAQAAKAKPTRQTASAPFDDTEFDELAALNELESEAEALEAAAAAAAHAAAAAKSAYLARHLSDQANAEEPAPTPKASKASGGARQSGDYLDTLARAFDNLNSNQWNPEALDDATAGMSMVLGSGPAFAALGSMLANSTAQGSVLMNATQMQRQLDQVGLCCTSACVKQLLSMNDPYEPE